MKKAAIVMVFMLMGGFAHAATEIKADGYADAVKSGLSVVEFYSPACPYCKKMISIVEQFEKARPEVRVYKLNVDTNKDFAMSKGIQSWPTFIVYKEGLEIFRFKGAMEYERFAKLGGVTERPSGDFMIDLRVEELEAEYAYLAEKNNRMAEEAQKIAMRLNQLPTAIDELKKLKSASAQPDCPSGSCG